MLLLLCGKDKKKERKKLHQSLFRMDEKVTHRRYYKWVKAVCFAFLSLRIDGKKGK
jgi:hypothetical protein